MPFFTHIILFIKLDVKLVGRAGTALVPECQPNGIPLLSRGRHDEVRVTGVWGHAAEMSPTPHVLNHMWVLNPSDSENVNPTRFLWLFGQEKDSFKSYSKILFATLWAIWFGFNGSQQTQDFYPPTQLKCGSNYLIRRFCL